MSDLIERQAAIDVIMKRGKRIPTYAIACKEALEALPPAQPEPLTLRVNPELTKEEYDKLMHDIKDAPIVLLPSAQSDNDMIHLQKEQAYLQGWEEGREALRKEIWEDGRDRLNKQTGGNKGAKDVPDISF